MKVLSVKVLGVSSDMYDEMSAMLSDVLGLNKVGEGEGFSSFETTKGDVVEIFRKGSAGAHSDSSPVAGFLVDDIDDAVSMLRSSGVELVGPTQTGKTGHRWQAFWGPDGNTYELTWTGEEE